MDLKKITENNTRVITGNSCKELSNGNPVIFCINNELKETIKDKAIQRRLKYGFD